MLVLALDKKENNRGATALLAVLATSVIIVIISLSMVNLGYGLYSQQRNYGGIVDTYYLTRAGLDEAMFQLKKEPERLLFSDLTLGSSTVQRFFANTGCVTNCPVVIEALSTSSLASEKLQYSCSDTITDCVYERLIP